MAGQKIYKNRVGITTLAVLSGLLYSSWPLARWLNPVVNQDLASNLEASGQPYNWVFVGCDIASGLLVILISVWLYKTVKKPKVWLKYSLIGYGLFGLFTILDAVTPLDCVHVIQKCGAVLDDPWFILHGFFSFSSVAALSISVLGVWWLLANGRKAGDLLKLLLDGTVLAWAGFGLYAVVLMLLLKTSAMGQHLFITLVSVFMATMPYLTYKIVNRG